MTEPSPYTFKQNNLHKLDIHIDRATNFDTWRTQCEAYLNFYGLANVRRCATKQLLDDMVIYDKDEANHKERQFLKWSQDRR